MLQKLIPSVVCKRGRFISVILSLPCTSGCTFINDFKRPLLKAWLETRLKQVCSSVVEHWSTESKGLRFHSSWGLKIFALSHACDKTKIIFFQGLNTWFLKLLSSFNILLSMDGFRVVKIDMVVKNIDILITCTGIWQEKPEHF